MQWGRVLFQRLLSIVLRVSTASSPNRSLLSLLRLSGLSLWLSLGGSCSSGRSSRGRSGGSVWVGGGCRLSCPCCRSTCTVLSWSSRGGCFVLINDVALGVCEGRNRSSVADGVTFELRGSNHLSFRWKWRRRLLRLQKLEGLQQLWWYVEWLLRVWEFHQQKGNGRKSALVVVRKERQCVHQVGSRSEGGLAKT